MSEQKAPSFATLSLHAGQKPDPATGARAVPIYQTSSFQFENTEQAAALFNLERDGHIYTRISNPTVAVLEERLAALEGGVGALATSSGQAALFTAITALLGAGCHIVAPLSIYGGSMNLLNLTLPRFGIETTFIESRDPEAYRQAIRPNTRLIFGELLSNPGLDVMPVAALADIAHAAGLPLMVDATCATPILCQPISFGADIIVHSLTKWIGGHGTAIGGAIVDAGRFDWAASAGFPTLTEPYAGYHGITFTKTFGPKAFIMRARNEGMRDFGCCMAPATAFHILQGLETLPLRMARHVENARLVRAFLEQHPYVRWVRHPECCDHPDHRLAQEMMPKGAGSLLTFGVRSGVEGGGRFMNALSMISHLANIGDAKTLAIHPASTTQRQLDQQTLCATGLGDDMIRLSVGLEDIQDILDDLDQALIASD